MIAQSVERMYLELIIFIREVLGSIPSQALSTKQVVTGCKCRCVRGRIASCLITGEVSGVNLSLEKLEQDIHPSPSLEVSAYKGF